MIIKPFSYEITFSTFGDAGSNKRRDFWEKIKNNPWNIPGHEFSHYYFGKKMGTIPIIVAYNV